MTAYQREDIQGLRAIAILMVAAWHAGAPLPGAFTGVDVFFVVSGFVITGTLLREQATTGGISLVRFYSRRIRRLLPALALLSVVTLLLAMCVLSPIGPRQEMTGRAVRAATTITANLFFLRETGGYFQPVAQENPFLHTWTLSVEEQFYLVFPLAFATLWRLWRGRNATSTWVIVSVAAMFLVSLALNIAISYGWETPWPYLAIRISSYGPLRVAFLSPMTRAWEFLAGALITLIAARRTVPARIRWWMAIAGAVLLLITLAAVQSTAVFPGVWALLPVSGTVCLLIAGLGGGGAASASDAPSFVTRALSTRPMVWIGDRSYSWYLWHWPLIVYARVLFAPSPQLATLAVIAALVPAALSFQFVEEPIRRRRVWPSPRATAAIAGACVIVPLFGAIGLIVETNRSWGDPGLATIRARVAPDHIDLVEPCASFTPLGDKNRAPCIWPTPGSRGTMLLIGDSNAGHLSEPFIAATHALGYDAQLATAGGCPFLLRARYFDNACREFVEGSAAAIVRHTPAYAAVVISNASVGYLNGHTAGQFMGDDSAPHHDRAAAIEGWTAAMNRTLDALTPHSPVVVVGAVPQFYRIPDCLRPTLFARPTPECGHWAPYLVAELRTDLITAERTGALAHGATYFDTGDTLCDPTSGCSAFIDGALAYRDVAHLSVWGAMQFEPALEAALSAARQRR